MILQCFSFLFLSRHLIFHVGTRLNFCLYILGFVTIGISLNYQCLHLFDKVSVNMELRDYWAITSKQTNKEINTIKEKQWEKTSNVEKVYPLHPGEFSSSSQYKRGSKIVEWLMSFVHYQKLELGIKLNPMKSKTRNSCSEAYDPLNALFSTCLYKSLQEVRASSLSDHISTVTQLFCYFVHVCVRSIHNIDEQINFKILNL